MIVAKGLLPMALTEGANVIEPRFSTTKVHYITG